MFLGNDALRNRPAADFHSETSVDNGVQQNDTEFVPLVQLGGAKSLKLEEAGGFVLNSANESGFCEGNLAVEHSDFDIVGNSSSTLNNTGLDIIGNNCDGDINQLYFDLFLSALDDQSPVVFGERALEKIVIENFTNFKDIYLNITVTPDRAFTWLKKHKLIPDDGTPCPDCLQKRRPGILKYYGSLTENRKGGRRLQCSGVGKLCRKKYSPFTNTIFDGNICRIEVGKVIELIYCWMQKLRIVNTVNEVGVSRNTVIEYFNFCREICCNALEDESEVIGGPGRLVLIAESKYHHRKYYRALGNKFRLNQGFVFGGIERGTDKVFLVRVPSVAKTELIPIIRKYIRSGSIIVTEDYKAYTDLEKDKYSYTVWGLRSFVSPRNLKWQVFNNELNWKFARGSDQDTTSIEELKDSYLQEYLYRKAHKDIVQDFFHHLRVYCRHPLL